MDGNSLVVGDESCHLRLESHGDGWPNALFRVEAKVSLEGRAEISGSVEALLFATDDKVQAELRDFAELRSSHVTLPMSEGSSIELRRDPHGHVDVIFSVKCWRLGPHWAISGDVRVPGEFTQQFLRDLRLLVFGRLRPA